MLEKLYPCRWGLGGLNVGPSLHVVSCSVNRVYHHPKDPHFLSHYLQLPSEKDV